MARQRRAAALLERLRQLLGSQHTAAFCSSAAGAPVRPQSSGQLAPFGRASWLAHRRPGGMQQQRHRPEGMRWAQVRVAGSELQPAGTKPALAGEGACVGLVPAVDTGPNMHAFFSLISLPSFGMLPADSGSGTAGSGGCSVAHSSGLCAACGAATSARQQGAAVAEGAGHIRGQLEANRGEVQGCETGRIC